MERDKPQDLNLNSTVVDVAFHPHKDYLAVGLIEGPVHVYSYSSTEANHELLTFKHHKKAVRALRFSSTGDHICTVSRDKSLRVTDLEKGAVTLAIKKAHESAIYSILNINDNIVATGDDDGVLKVWDLRQSKSVMECTDTSEFISDMGIEKNGRVLLATSGEGTLSAFDIRKHKLKVQSELFDAEFLSLAIMKGEQKVVCGAGDGTLNIFNWGGYGNISDRFPGHPDSIDCMVKLNEDVFFTGSIDGKIRAVHLLPNRFLGAVGEHEDGFPVENLALSRCKTYLASCSHDNVLKFWNVQDAEDAVEDEVVGDKKQTKGIKNKPLQKTAKQDDFFSDLMEPAGSDKEEDDDDDDGDSDEDSDSDDSEADRPKKKLKVTSDSKPQNGSNDTSSGSSSKIEDIKAECSNSESGDSDKDTDDEEEEEEDGSDQGEISEGEDDSESDSDDDDDEEVDDVDTGQK